MAVAARVRTCPILICAKVVCCQIAVLWVLSFWWQSKVNWSGSCWLFTHEHHHTLTHTNTDCESEVNTKTWQS